MSTSVAWIAAQAEPTDPSDIVASLNKSQDASDCAKTFDDDPLDRNPELRAYRGRTIGLLRRYLRYSLEAGRLPSLLGAEFFRTRVTTYATVTFEDRVILVHDMERCLERLSDFSRQLIARYILQEHDLSATARLLHCNEKTVRRTIPMALDELSEILLEVGLLERLPSVEQKSCQEGEMDQFLPSDWKEGENKF